MTNLIFTNMPTQTCYATHRPLSGDALCVHRNVLDAMGWGPRRYEEDEYGEEVEVPMFIHTFKGHLRHRGIFCNFSRHVRLSTTAANMPKIKDFEDALYRARNFELARILALTQACSENQTYRVKFMSNPCFDGSKDWLTQAMEFFLEKYHTLETEHANILAQFRDAETKLEYLGVFDQMLDLRYGKNNRRPNTWTCWPEAQIHPEDLVLFPDEEG